MNLEDIFQDKSIKVKGKVKIICEGLKNSDLSVAELLVFAESQPLKDKATCFEGIECATRTNTKIASDDLLNHMTRALENDEPRIKWESAKVIGIIAAKFPYSLMPSVENLLKNANEEGTEVRWASAYALGEIIKLRHKDNEGLVGKVHEMSVKELDNGVKKKYIDALKKVKA